MSDVLLLWIGILKFVIPLLLFIWVLTTLAKIRDSTAASADEAKRNRRVAEDSMSRLNAIVDGQTALLEAIERSDQRAAIRADAEAEDA